MLRTVLLLPLLGLVTFADGASPRDLIEARRWKQARATLEPYVKAHPNDAEACALLARVKMIFKEPDAALRLAERAVALQPRNDAYRWRVAAVVGEMAAEASVFKQLGLGRRFKREADATLALNPRHVEALDSLMIFYLKAPGIMGGDTRKAYALADEILKIDKGAGYLAKVRLAHEAKQTDRVEGLYLKAVEADPDEFDAQRALATMYIAASPPKLDAAERHARAMIRIAPARADGHAALASVLAAQRRWQELDAALVAAEQANRDNLLPYYRAGIPLIASGADLPRAERYFRKYLTITPEPNTPDHAAAHWRLGLTLEKQGRRDEAIAAMHKAVQLNPRMEDARRDLKRIKS